MTRDELKALIQGPIATVPTPFDDRFRINYGLMADLTQWWVEQGLVTGRAVIKVAAAMGEGYQLTDEEWPALLQTVVQAANGKATIVCGLKPKDTIHTIEDARRAQDLGAVGVQIDLPLFNHPSQDDIVRFFTDISDAIDIGILIYNTWFFGVPSLTRDTLSRLTDAEHVVAIKWSVPPDGSVDYDDMREFAGIFNFIDNSLEIARCHRNGGRGFINYSAHVYPPHALEVWRLLEEGRFEEAQALYDQVHLPIGRLMEKFARRSGGYRVPKAMMAVVGKPVGHTRPPSLPLSREELSELYDTMATFGWPLADREAVLSGAAVARR
jgi:4-hydroxy-tetrahydrodipicolinate synthase